MPVLVALFVFTVFVSLALALLLAPSFSRGILWLIRFVNSIPQQPIWVTVSVILCLRGARLLLRWLRESRGRSQRRTTLPPGVHAIRALRGELLVAHKSGYFRDRVFLRLRHLAVTVVSLQEGIQEAKAWGMLVHGTWTSDSRLLDFTRRILKPQTPLGAKKIEREQFVDDIEDFLLRLTDYPRAGESSGNGRSHGN